MQEFNISVEELSLKGARKEGFLFKKQSFISNKVLNKLIKIRTCKCFFSLFISVFDTILFYRARSLLRLV